MQTQEKDFALVLAGGGAKGAYQIGVWKALIDLGIDKRVAIVSGTSVGALNGALFLTKKYDQARNIWDNITLIDMLDLDTVIKKSLPIVTVKKNLHQTGYLLALKILAKLVGIIFGIKNLATSSIRTSRVLKNVYVTSYSFKNISLSKIEKIIDTMILDVLNSDIELIVCCSMLRTKTPKYFHLNAYKDNPDLVKKILLASCSLKPFYKSIKINGVKYADGGHSMNVPAEGIYKIMHKIPSIKNIIVVRFNDDCTLYQCKNNSHALLNHFDINYPVKNLSSIFNLFNTTKRKLYEQGYIDTVNALKSK